jgi:hypothetical protein
MPIIGVFKISNTQVRALQKFQKHHCFVSMMR